MENNAKIYLSKNIVEIPIDNEFEVVYRKDKYKPMCVKKSIIENWEKCNSKVIEKLLEKGILIVGEDVEADIPNEIRRLRANYHDNTLEIRMVASYLCDEACSYCLAGNAMKNCKDVFDIEWIDNLCDVTSYFLGLHKEINTISFTFIGGEPLLDVNWNVYKSLLDKFRERFCDNKVITRVITNGNKLKNRDFSGYLSYIDEIYLSYDIRGHINDQSQPIQRNNDRPFLELLQELLENFSTVTLDFKINEFSTISKDSIFFDRIKTISKKYGKKLVLAASPIVTLEEFDPYHRKHVGKYDLRELSERNSINALRELKEYYGEYFAFWPRMEECAVYRCKSANNHTLMVYPNGKVSICGKLYTNTSGEVPIIADLKNGGKINENMLINEDTILEDDECMNCDYYFVCGGKCPLMSDSTCDEEKIIARLFIEVAAKYEIEKRMRKTNGGNKD